MSKIDIGRAIKARRNQLRIRQPDLAELANVSVNSLYKIERGTANPTLDILEQIASVLGMELKIMVKQAGE